MDKQPRPLIAIITDLKAELDKLDLKGRWTTAKTGGANGASRLICVDTQILGEVYRADDAQVIAASMNGLRSMLEVATRLLNSMDAANVTPKGYPVAYETWTYLIGEMLRPFCTEFNVPMEESNES